MNITMENFKTAKYDVFSIFDDRWGLCTAGTPREYNTMTIGWGTMGTIWGPPKKGKQIITVFIRESRRTHQILQKEDEFTVCFFPEKYRKDLGILGSKSGNDVPEFTRDTLYKDGDLHYLYMGEIEDVFGMIEE